MPDTNPYTPKKHDKILDKVEKELSKPMVFDLSEISTGTTKTIYLDDLITEKEFWSLT